jgi:hypothetical protein
MEVAGEWSEGAVFVFLGDGSVDRGGITVDVAEGPGPVNDNAGKDCSSEFAKDTGGFSTVPAPLCKSSVMV